MGYDDRDDGYGGGSGGSSPAPSRDLDDEIPF
jgi:single-strand DNA-binding protein